jgi:(R,R)-butanediol dehydrogenase/meso-butanediol dehydrogenase/diacetyl reductase
MKMKAALWYGAKDIRVEEVEEPKPGLNEVKIKVKACGICGTDLHDYTSGPQVIPVDVPHPITGDKAPIILGHEFSGEIVEVGPDVTKWHPGDRVSVMPLLNCGKCYYCTRGLNHLCQDFGCTGLQWRWGGFADYCLAKEYQLNRIPDNVSFELGAVIEPAALAVYGIDRGGVKLGDKVFIAGGGPTAVLMMMAAQAAGASAVYMSEVAKGRLERLEAFGATEVFNPAKCSVVDEILQRTDGIGADVTIDCTGVEAAIGNCLKIVRKRGTHVQSGLSIGSVGIDTFDLAFKDVTMIGLWCYNIYDFPKILALLSAEKFHLEKFITKRIKLDEIVSEGFESLTDPQLGANELKIMVIL